jgi:hypothetical protein
MAQVIPVLLLTLVVEMATIGTRLSDIQNPLPMAKEKTRQVIKESVPNLVRTGRLAFQIAVSYALTATHNLLKLHRHALRVATV